MKLRVLKAYSGAMGNATQGQILTVNESLGKQLISRGYPVEVVPNESKQSTGRRRSKPPANN